MKLYCGPIIRKIASKLLLIILTLIICRNDVFAQRTEQDFRDLQERAVSENWSFSVSRTDAFFNPVPLPDSTGSRPELEEDFILPEVSGPLVTTQAMPTMVPASWNWCDWGICSSIKNQGGCGGCFAFSAMGIFESAILLNDAREVDLSEQWAISCTGAGNCVNGGFPGTVLDYTLCNASVSDSCGDHGAVMESEFPFAGSDVSCNSCPYDHPYCADSWSRIDSSVYIPTVDKIKRAILQYGPVSVHIAAGPAFQAYSGGVFNSCSAPTPNHYVVLVGWDDSQGTDGVWILRNSYGERWGEDENGASWDPNGDGIQDNPGGYMRIEYGCDNVGGFALYMRYQDTSEAVWADFSSSGTEDGSFWQPYISLQEAVNQVYIRGHILFKPGSTRETLRVTKPMKLRAANGPVVIGR